MYKYWEVCYKSFQSPKGRNTLTMGEAHRLKTEKMEKALKGRDTLSIVLMFRWILFTCIFAMRAPSFGHPSEERECYQETFKGSNPM